MSVATLQVARKTALLCSKLDKLRCENQVDIYKTALLLFLPFSLCYACTPCLCVCFYGFSLLQSLYSGGSGSLEGGVDVESEFCPPLLFFLSFPFLPSPTLPSLPVNPATESGGVL